LCCVAGIGFANENGIMAKQPPDAPDKAGVESFSKKEDSTRHGFDPQPASGKAGGASGREEGELNALESNLGEPSESKQKSLGRMKSPRRDPSEETKE
jgi:hypothetical protein